eukprot:7615018-Ditylum_brightwellii.AAC.1
MVPGGAPSGKPIVEHSCHRVSPQNAWEKRQLCVAAETESVVTAIRILELNILTSNDVLQ